MNGLKKDPLIYYIYDVGNNIYFNNNNSIYIVIGNFTNSKLKKYAKDYDNEKYKFYTMDQWIKLIENFNLLPFICFSLKKSHKIKEYISLNYNISKFKLVENFDKYFKDYSKLLFNTISDRIYSYCNLIRELYYTNQLLSSSKVTNYKYITDIISNLSNYKDTEELNNYFNKLLKKELYTWHKHADPILKEAQIKRIKSKYSL